MEFWPRETKRKQPLLKLAAKGASTFRGAPLESRFFQGGRGGLTTSSGRSRQPRGDGASANRHQGSAGDAQQPARLDGGRPTLAATRVQPPHADDGWSRPATRGSPPLKDPPPPPQHSHLLHAPGSCSLDAAGGGSSSGVAASVSRPAGSRVRPMTQGGLPSNPTRGSYRSNPSIGGNSQFSGGPPPSAIQSSSTYGTPSAGGFPSSLPVLPPHAVGMNPTLSSDHEEPRDLALLDEREKLRMWLDKFSEEKSEFHSAFVHAQLKLQGLLDDKAIDHKAPSSFKTGAAITLLNDVLVHMGGANSGLLMQLWQMVVDSVYMGGAAKSFTSAEDLACDPAAGSQKANMPYFEQVDQLRMQNIDLASQLRVFEQARSVIDAEHKRLATLNRHHLLIWANRHLQMTFCNWKRQTQDSVRKEKTAVMTISRLRKVHEVDLLVCFNEWKSYLAEMKNQRKIQNHFEIESGMKDMKKLTADQELHVLKEQLATNLEESVKLRLMKRELQSSQTTMYKEMLSWRHSGATRHCCNVRTAAAFKVQLGLVRNNVWLVFHHHKSHGKDGHKDVGQDLSNPAEHLEERKLASRRVEKSSARDITMMWLNYQLKQAKQPAVENFGKDFGDGVALLHLLNQLGHRIPLCSRAEDMQAMTKYERAELVIKAAIAFLPKDATVQMCSTDIVIHNSEVIFAFMIQVMMFCPALPIEPTDVCYKHLTQTIKSLDNSMTMFDNIVGDYKHLGATEAVIDHRAAKMVESIQQHWVDNSLALEHCYVYMSHIAGDWQTISHKLMTKLVDLQSKHSQEQTEDLGQDTEMSDEMKEIPKSWYSLSYERIEDLFDSYDMVDIRKAEMEKAELVLLSNAENQQLVFKHYCEIGLEIHYGETEKGDETGSHADDVAAGLNFRQWLQFVQDIGMLKPVLSSGGEATDRNFLSKSLAEKIFERANLNDDLSKKVDQHESMKPHQFIESVVRIASQHINKPAMYERLSDLIKYHITPNAGKLDKTHFADLLSEKEMQVCMRKYSPKLRKIFVYFCNQDKQGDRLKVSSANSTINFKELSLLVDKFGLVWPGFEHHDLKRIFRQIQDDGAADCTDFNNDSELVFNEFVELLITMACFRDPSPFDPLVQKVTSFLDTFIIGNPEYAKLPDYTELNATGRAATPKRKTAAQLGPPEVFGGHN